MDIKQALSQADLFIRQNQTAQARTILGQILLDNPQNEEAWILSAQVSDKPEQVIYCLRQAIKINPASRAHLLLERLQLPQTPPAPVESSEPAPQPLSETQPHQAVRLAVIPPEQAMSLPAGITDPGPDDNATDLTDLPPDVATVPSMPSAVAAIPSMPLAVAATPSELPAPQASPHKRPQRWLQRIFTIAATACLAAPWITIQNGASPSSMLSGAQVLLGPIFSPLGVDVGISSLALLASLVLPLLMFFRFRSAATQKWGERATIALAPLASVLCLDMISFFYAGLTNNIILRWGIWASCGFYSLAGLTALINARRLGNVGRTELYAARAGWIFTWLFSFGDILALLVTMIGLVVMGKFSLFGISIPFIWLCLGALLSHIV
ncbi:MAG: hypothetical protein ABSA23_13000 [Anaerolineales bacterium]|jgi:hypothetical protein